MSTGDMGTPPTGAAPESVRSGAGAERMDEYSDILGMTPREHERRMRKWYVLLAIVGFFGVFGEGFLVMASRSRRADEQGNADERAAELAQPSTLPGARGTVLGAPDSVARSADSTSSPDSGEGRR